MNIYLQRISDKLNKLIFNTKKMFFKIEQRVPYIPDFSDVWTILKVLLVSFLLCAIYSFAEITHASDFYNKFIPNIKIFAPYVIFQLLLLIFFNPIIQKQKALNAILIIIVLNFLCVYLINAAINQTFTKFFADGDAVIAQFFVSFGILFLFLIYFDWRKKNIDPANTLAKLIFLQAKMRPHFLFNTLNSVISLMKKDPDTARKMLVNLSDLLRASIKEEEVSMYSIKEEVTLCKKYLDIEKIRLGERMKVTWSIDESVLSYSIPRLVIQPLVENSVLHGVQNLENGGDIFINITSSESKILIEITNPISKKVMYNNDKHNNISLSNLKERLKIYFYGDVKFETSIINAVYHVKLTIPKKNTNGLFPND